MGYGFIWDPCYKDVTCRTCHRSFRCVPNDDYYGSSCATDGQCEQCMLAEEIPLIQQECAEWKLTGRKRKRRNAIISVIVIAVLIVTILLAVL